MTPLPDGQPRYGRVGPDDPRADPVTMPALRAPRPAELDGPATDPGLRPVPPAPPAARPAPPDPPTVPVVARTRASGLWTGMILSGVVFGLLLVFIVQNQATVKIHILFSEPEVPIGVALLMAAVAGMLIVAIPGGVRMLQLRRAARKAASSR